MAVCPAWLLAFGNGYRAAVGLREVVHVLPDPPTLFRVPRAGPACRSVFMWQGRIVPLVDPAAIAGDAPAAPDSSTLVVVAYQDAGEGSVNRGGLVLSQVPERVFVDDRHGLTRAQMPPAWMPFACGGYRDPAGTVPILDLGRIFSEDLATAA